VVEIKTYIIEKGKEAKNAARKLANVETNIKNNSLRRMSEALIENSQLIIAANQIDMRVGEEKGLSKAMLDRLMLNEKRIRDMAEGVRQIGELQDPIGEVPRMWRRPNGLQIGQVRVPLGVIGIIYEARPNVTADAAALCIKSGNAVLLRGGSEAINSNKAIAEIISKSGEEAGLPHNSIQYIDIIDREAVNVMLKLNEYIDVLIPRGGAGLIRNVVENATVPVIETGVGNCHIYVDDDANLNMAEEIVVNAKTQRPAVCNAMETLLIHKNCAQELIKNLVPRLISLGVEIRGCKITQALNGEIVAAVEQDWYTEFLDLILAVKVVESLDEALEHIYKYGTKHSEAIITNNYGNSQRFLREVDAAAVYVNASTRFTDGFEFGFGGEIGISTQKLHARGPMGLEQLTSIKYVVYGEGQTR
jgi:glutamate-5-semialdehyde dehydrogenase